MTWTITDSGPKDEVKKRVVEKVAGFHAHPAIADALGALIDQQSGPSISISGSGSNASVSLSISSTGTAPA